MTIRQTLDLKLSTIFHGSIRTIVRCLFHCDPPIMRDCIFLFSFCVVNPATATGSCPNARPLILEPAVLRTTRLLSIFTAGKNFSPVPSSGDCCVWLRSGASTPTLDSRKLLHLWSSRLRVNGASPPTKMSRMLRPLNPWSTPPQDFHSSPAKRRQDVEDALAVVQRLGHVQP